MQEEKVSKSVRSAPLPAAAEARSSSAQVQPRNVDERRDEKIRRALARPNFNRFAGQKDVAGQKTTSVTKERK